MADYRDAASTEDYWTFVPYNLALRGTNDVPERFRAQAQWEGHHNAGTGYYARSTHANDPIAVEFNYDHLACFGALKHTWRSVASLDILQAIRARGSTALEARR